jgi:hypothetical protein
MNISFLVATVLMCLFGASRLNGQSKQQFTKPVLMFDNTSMRIARPSEAIARQVEKLQVERGLGEAVSAVSDKNGMLRMAFLPPDGVQTNCTTYADVYFDKKGKWISTEEYFVVEPDSTKGLGRIVAKCSVALQSKNFKPGICEEGGKIAVWKISTPANTWYEYEVFKKSVENVALAVKTQQAPYSAPNADIHGTAYFDVNGTFVRIQTKSKIIILNPDLKAVSSKNK